MGKVINLTVDEQLKKNSDNFIKNNKSRLKYNATLNSDINNLDWLEIIEEVCPYIDNIVRNPKVVLVGETNVTKIEKARKTSIESIKDLSKHTDYIDKIDDKTGDVLPSKLLVLFREETYNTYENRFIYTLIINLLKFIQEKEEALKNIEPKNEKTIEYSAETTNGRDKVIVELSLKTVPTNVVNNGDNDFEKIVENLKKKLAGIKKSYINPWLASTLIVSLKKLHAPLVSPPIKKTNLILKNPNFQMALKLWDYLYAVMNGEAEDIESGNVKSGKLIKSIMDEAFLMDYYALDSITKDKKIEKEKLKSYALLIVMNQVQNAVNILLKNGIKIKESELLKLLSAEMEKKTNPNALGSSDIKQKFQKEMEDYLSKTNEYL